MVRQKVARCSDLVMFTIVVSSSAEKVPLTQRLQFNIYLVPVLDIEKAPLAQSSKLYKYPGPVAIKQKTIFAHNHV